MMLVRTFVALELPDEVKAYLGGLQETLLATAQRQRLDVGRSLKWVDPESIHLTLKFLGGVDVELLASLERAVESAALGVAAPRLRLVSLGAFPSPRQPRVLWAGLGGDLATVGTLQQRVEAELGKLGFQPEKRPFTPHLTLARLREQAGPDERRAVAALTAAAPGVVELAFITERLSLMKSELQPSGARYEALHTVHLRRAQA